MVGPGLVKAVERNHGHLCPSCPSCPLALSLLHKYKCRGEKCSLPLWLPKAGCKGSSYTFLPLFLVETLKMASSFSDESKEHCKSVPARSLRRTCSTNSSDAYGGQSTKSCVCAPTTHPGSFKCRLHRVNSHSHSSPPAQQPAVSASSARTVEAL